MPLAALLAPGRAGGVLPAAEAEQLAAGLGVGPLALTPAPAPEAGSEGEAAAVPREVAALLAALAADGGAALRTPGILVDSAPEAAARAGAAPESEPAAATAPAAAEAAEADAGVEAAAAAQQPASRAGQCALLRALEAVRLPLDGGCGVPPSAAPHDVAALLLLWCGQLPQPLISTAAADAAAAAPPVSPGDAAALLRRHCDAASRGVLAALLPVLRSALAPAAVAANGLSAARLAGALSAWWLPPLAAGASPDAGANRRRLLRMLLEPAAAGESLV